MLKFCFVFEFYYMIYFVAFVICLFYYSDLNTMVQVLYYMVYSRSIMDKLFYIESYLVLYILQVGRAGLRARIVNSASLGVVCHW